MRLLFTCPGSNIRVPGTPAAQVAHASNNSPGTADAVPGAFLDHLTGPNVNEESNEISNPALPSGRVKFTLFKSSTPNGKRYVLDEDADGNLFVVKDPDSGVVWASSPSFGRLASTPSRS